MNDDSKNVTEVSIESVEALPCAKAVRIKDVTIEYLFYNENQ